MNKNNTTHKWQTFLKVCAFSVTTLLISNPVYADETCQSPYMAKITGQEDFVYVWTLGIEGLGDEQDNW